MQPQVQWDGALPGPGTRCAAGSAVIFPRAMCSATATAWHALRKKKKRFVEQALQLSTISRPASQPQQPDAGELACSSCVRNLPSHICRCYQTGRCLDCWCTGRCDITVAAACRAGWQCCYAKAMVIPLHRCSATFSNKIFMHAVYCKRSNLQCLSHRRAPRTVSGCARRALAALPSGGGNFLPLGRACRQQARGAAADRRAEHALGHHAPLTWLTAPCAASAVAQCRNCANK